MVLANLPGDDIILCQITSQQNKDAYAIPITTAEFTQGSLPVDSYIRPTRIFTADKNIIIRKAGNIKANITNQVVQTLVNIFQ